MSRLRLEMLGTALHYWWDEKGRAGTCIILFFDHSIFTIRYTSSPKYIRTMLCAAGWPVWSQLLIEMMQISFSTSAIRCEEAELSCCRSHPKQKRHISEAVRLRVNAQITNLQRGPIVLNQTKASLMLFALRSYT